ncbi:hypothetical protein [Chelatococcus reniformis]|uniref:Uncharacterized protein n=1 Tax=Chelatococcus reniformis TaxID=1494448 RepID=A0A916UCT9_9HYPH|nr:hypothetical protein [Chelatococcus reniformis]GGC68740.1 hypothetical protein GCM10010994_29160 [Chelatococcus reniformis]
MIVVRRMVVDLGKHFAVRASEWGLAGMAAGYGVALLWPGDTFGTSPSYSFMAAIANESTWGLAALTIGLIRLTALFINGTYRRSPLIRAGTAFLCVDLWTAIALGLSAGDARAPATGLAIYPVLAALDIWNVYRSMRDGGEHGGRT